MSVLYALSGPLVVMCVLLSRAWGTTLAVLCYALLFPSSHVVIWLVTHVTTYWLAGCVQHTDTILELSFTSSGTLKSIKSALGYCIAISGHCKNCSIACDTGCLRNLSYWSRQQMNGLLWGSVHQFREAVSDHVTLHSNVVLSLCGCPTKLLQQQNSFDCAVTVAFDARCQHLSLCAHVCYSMSCCVLYCLLFTPAVQCWSTTITSTQVWSGSCERSCQKQEYYRVPNGAFGWPTGSWWYTSTTHSRWEEEVQSWTRSVWTSLHWALSSWWVVHSQSPHAVSVLCQWSPQWVVSEKQPLTPQLAVLVGWD